MNWTRVCAQVISDSHVAAGKKYTTARACFMVHSDIPRVQLCLVRISHKNYEAGARCRVFFTRGNTRVRNHLSTQFIVKTRDEYTQVHAEIIGRL